MAGFVFTGISISHAAPPAGYPGAVQILNEGPAALVLTWSDAHQEYQYDANPEQDGNWLKYTGTNQAGQALWNLCMPVGANAFQNGTFSWDGVSTPQQSGNWANTVAYPFATFDLYGQPLNLDRANRLELYGTNASQPGIVLDPTAGQIQVNGTDVVTQDTLANFSSVSIGNGASATASGGIALGQWSQSSAPYAVALGGAQATGYGAFAVGGDPTGISYNGGPTVASGQWSTALGASTATGEYATALGNGIAVGPFSVSIGSSYASGWLSSALGAAGAIDDYSSAFGASLAIGIYSTASGGSWTRSDSATALGNSGAYGDFSSAFGFSQATGQCATASGFAWAVGDFSSAFGPYASAQGYGQFVIGSYNVLQGDQYSWVLTDNLFVIGNGTDSSHPADALEVKKNGDMKVNGNLVVTGTAHSVLINPQGDLSMGVFQTGPHP